MDVGPNRLAEWGYGLFFGIHPGSDSSPLIPDDGLGWGLLKTGRLGTYDVVPGVTLWRIPKNINIRKK